MLTNIGLPGILLLLILIVIVFVVPGKMAANRNRSVVGWILISLILSPIIAIIALLVLGTPYRPDTEA